MLTFGEMFRDSRLIRAVVAAHHIEQSTDVFRRLAGPVIERSCRRPQLWPVRTIHLAIRIQLADIADAFHGLDQRGVGLAYSQGDFKDARGNV